MKIEKIELENFRGWNGSHEIKFSTDPKKPVTLIIAENGTGKSNILEAIMWCLYGKLPDNSKDPEIIKCMHCENPKAGARVALEIVDDRESNISGNKNPKYLISRTINHRGEISTAIYEKDPNRQKLREYKRQELLVEKLLPERLSKFYLFSGEGIEQLFDETDEALLKESIEFMQGLTFARSALKDLEKYKNSLVDQKSKNNKANIKAKNAGIKFKTLSKSKDEKEKLKANLEKELIELRKRRKTIGDLIKESNHEVAKKTKELEEDTIKNRSNNQSRLLIHESEQKRLMEVGAASIHLSKEKEFLKQFLKENELEGIIPFPYNEKFVDKILDRKVCICGTKFTEGSNEHKCISQLMDQAGTTEQSRNHAYLSGFITQFGVENRRFREAYDLKLEEINSLEGLIKTDSAKIEKLRAKLMNLKDDDIDKLLKEDEKLENKEFLLPSQIEKLALEIKTIIKEMKVQEKIIEGGTSVDIELERKYKFIEGTYASLESQIVTTKKDGRDTLLEKLNVLSKKYDTKQQRFEYADESSYTPLMIDSVLNKETPPNQGNTVLKSIFYATALLDICIERFENESTLIQPGTIAPMVCDAVFSALGVANTATVTKLLCTVPEQTILMINAESYNGKCKETLDKNNLVGKSYYFQRSQKAAVDDSLAEIEINGKVLKAFIQDNKITTNQVKPLRT